MNVTIQIYSISYSNSEINLWLRIRMEYELSQNRGISCLVWVVLGTGCLGYELSCCQLY